MSPITDLVATVTGPMVFTSSAGHFTAVRHEDLFEGAKVVILTEPDADGDVAILVQNADGSDGSYELTICATSLTPIGSTEPIGGHVAETPEPRSRDFIESLLRYSGRVMQLAEDAMTDALSRAARYGLTPDEIEIYVNEGRDGK